MDLTTIAITEDELSPKEFLELNSTEKANIESTRIIPLLAYQMN